MAINTTLNPPSQLHQDIMHDDAINNYKAVIFVYKKFTNITECVIEFCMINDLTINVDDDIFEISDNEESMSIKTHLENVQTDKVNDRFLATGTLVIEYKSESKEFVDKYLNNLYQFISNNLEGITIVS